MISALTILTVVAALINVCAAIASVTFAVQTIVITRRMDRQRRQLWERR